MEMFTEEGHPIADDNGTESDNGLVWGDRRLTKILCLVIAFVVETTFTALPIVVSGWFYKRGENGLMALRVLRCFGGGVFLGNFLLHVTPEVIHLIEDAGLPKDYPYPMLFIGGGFFMMLFAEKCVHVCTQGHGHSHEHGHSHDSGHDNHGKDIPMSTISEEDTQISRPKSYTGSYRKVDPDEVIVEAKSADELRRTIRARTLSEGKPPVYNYDGKTAQSHGHSHALPDTGGNFAKAILLLFALSLDSIFEGMALGLQEDSTGCWTLLAAILSHEVVMAFTLGLQLLRTNSRSKVLVLAFVYGSMCPIGIGIGTLIMEVFATESVSDIIPGVFQAITAGVFIYCTFFEILADEIASDTPLSCIISIGMGFAMMALLMLVPHGHEHGGHDHDHGDHDHGHDHGHSHDHDHASTQQEILTEEAARALFSATFRAPRN